MGYSLPGIDPDIDSPPQLQPPEDPSCMLGIPCISMPPDEKPESKFWPPQSEHSLPQEPNADGTSMGCPGI
jgi:hypothetical protein